MLWSFLKFDGNKYRDVQASLTWKTGKLECTDRTYVADRIYQDMADTTNELENTKSYLLSHSAKIESVQPEAVPPSWQAESNQRSKVASNGWDARQKNFST